jgi:hypothetical protein
MLVFFSAVQTIKIFAKLYILMINQVVRGLSLYLSLKEPEIITRAKEASLEYMLQVLSEMCKGNPELIAEIEKKSQSFLHSRKACKALGINYNRVTKGEGISSEYHAYLSIVEGQDPLMDLIIYG